MKLPYEQIDFYPNQIYVMIYSREPIEERKVENSIRLLYADLTEKKQRCHRSLSEQHSLE